MTTLKQKKPVKLTAAAELRLARRALEAIEMIVSDDEMEDWEMRRARLRGRSRVMLDRLSQIYRYAHSARPHSCFGAHASWRLETIQATSDAFIAAAVADSLSRE